MVSSVSAVMSWTTSISSAFRRPIFHELFGDVEHARVVGLHRAVAERLHQDVVRLAQFGSLVSAVNRPSPATARTRRSGPRTRLVEPFSSRARRPDRGGRRRREARPSCQPEDRPEFHSQPHQILHRRRQIQRQHVPTTGLVGGCGIGLSRLPDANFELSPARCLTRAVIAGSAATMLLRASTRLPRHDHLGTDSSGFPASNGRCARYFSRSGSASPCRRPDGGGT